MAYFSGGTIAAGDYNTFATTVNSIWGNSGFVGSRGYGQAGADLGVASPNIIYAAEWQTMCDRIDLAKKHQSGVARTVFRPSTGNIITYTTAFDTDINTINTGKLNNNGYRTAAQSGSGVHGNVANSTNFTTSSEKIVYLQWPTANNMRYFFNCGGWVDWGVSLTAFAATSKGTAWNTLCDAIGNARITATNTQQVGGTAGTSVNANLGFWGGNWSNPLSFQTVLSRNIATTLGGYQGGYIDLSCRFDAAPGSARTLYLRAVFSDIVDSGFDDVLTGTTYMDTYYYNPTTTYLPTASWGTPTWSVAQTNFQN